MHYHFYPSLLFVSPGRSCEYLYVSSTLVFGVLDGLNKYYDKRAVLGSGPNSCATVSTCDCGDNDIKSLEDILLSVDKERRNAADLL